MANSMTFNAETEEHTPSLKQAKEEHAFASFNFFLQFTNIDAYSL